MPKQFSSRTAPENKIDSTRKESGKHPATTRNYPQGQTSQVVILRDVMRDVWSASPRLPAWASLGLTCPCAISGTSVGPAGSMERRHPAHPATTRTSRNHPHIPQPPAHPATTRTSQARLRKSAAPGAPVRRSVTPTGAGQRSLARRVEHLERSGDGHRRAGASVMFRSRHLLGPTPGARVRRRRGPR